MENIKKSQELQNFLNESLCKKITKIYKDRKKIWERIVLFFKYFYPIFLLFGASLYFLWRIVSEM